MKTLREAVTFDLKAARAFEADQRRYCRFVPPNDYKNALDEIERLRTMTDALGMECDDLEKTRDDNADLVLERDAEIARLRERLEAAEEAASHAEEQHDYCSCARFVEWRALRDAQEKR